MPSPLRVGDFLLGPAVGPESLSGTFASFQLSGVPKIPVIWGMAVSRTQAAAAALLPGAVGASSSAWPKDDNCFPRVMAPFI